MMKSYAIAALALATGLSAFAGVRTSNSQMGTVQLQEFQKSIEMKAQPSKIVRANGPKKVTSVSDLYGPYSGKNLLSGENNPFYEFSTNAVAGAAENEIVFSNVISFNDGTVNMVGTVDLEKQTITIGRQDFFIDNASGEMVFLQPLAWTEDPEKPGSYSADEVNTLVFRIQEDGTLVCPDGGFGIRVTQGWYFICGLITMTPPDYFTFNENEWTSVGMGKYTDNVFVNFYKDFAPEAVDAEVFVKKGEGYLIAVKNPYAAGVWAEANPGLASGVYSGEGFVVFDTTYPDCVPMRPATASGFWINEDEAGTVWSECFPYNTEGRKYFLDDMMIEDVEMEFLAVGDPVSTYNKNTRIAELVNIWFGDSANPYTAYGFGEEQDPNTGAVTKWKKTTITVEIPEFTGVEGVEIENADAAVKYYNMQGMEIANPAEGQLVIKKQGNKAVKVIM